MATIKATINNAIGRADSSAILVTWAAIGDSDTCAPFSLYPDYQIKSVHASGTFNSATIVLNGSNTGVNYVGLKDLQGSLISKTSEGVSSVQDNMAYYQPASSGGSSSSTTVTILFLRASQPRG